MGAPVTTDLIWSQIGKRLFAVLSFVTPNQEARSAGVMYVVEGRKLYVSTQASSWKAKHIAANPHVAVTVNIPKRIPFFPWAKIPDATISFHGNARELPPEQVDPALRKRLFGPLPDPAMLKEATIIEITPAGDFVTYGVGVNLMEMAKRDLARGRAPV